MFQCVVVRFSVLESVAVSKMTVSRVGLASRCVCDMLQYVAVCCSEMQCVAVCCSVLQCVAVCSSVLQCVAV